MRSLQLTIVGLTMALGIACAHKKVQFKNGENVASIQGKLTVTTDWVKWKKDKMDIQYALENKMDKLAIIKEDAFKLKYNGRVGISRRYGRVFEVPAGGAMIINMTYDFGTEVPNKGEILTSIDPIFEGTHEVTGKKIGSIEMKLDFSEK